MASPFLESQPLMSSLSLSPRSLSMPFDHASRHLREIESATSPKLIIWVGDRRNRSASRDTIWSTLAPSPRLLIEPSDTEVAIWRPVRGSMLFTAKDFDAFRAAAGELLAQVGENGEHPAMAAVGAG